MKYRQINTTTHPIPFLLVSQLDGITPATGLNPTVWIKKSGGSFANANGGVTEDVFGWYNWTPNATDRNTLGPLVIHASGFNALPWDDVYTIVSHDPFTNVVTVSGTYDKVGYSIAGTKTTLDSLNDITSTSVWTVSGRTVDATGILLNTINTNINNLNNLNASQVWTYADRKLTTAVDATGILLNSALSNIAALNDLSATDVWSYSDRYLTRAVDATGTLLNTISSRTDVATSTRLAGSAVPSNFSSLSITAAGLVGTQAVAVSGNYDKGGYLIAGTKTSLDNLNDITPAQVRTQTSGALQDFRLNELLYNTMGSPFVTSTFGHLIEPSGVGYRFNRLALSLGPTGSGGGSSVNIDDIWNYNNRTLTNFGFAVDATGVKLDTILSRVDVNTSTRLASSGVPRNFDNLYIKVNSGSGYVQLDSQTYNDISDDVWNNTSWAYMGAVGGALYEVWTQRNSNTGVLTGGQLNQIWSHTNRSLNTAVALSGNYDKFGYSILGTKTTLDALNDISKSQVRIENSGALQDFRLNELLYSTVNTPYIDSLYGNLTEASGVGRRFTKLALSLGPTGTGIGGGSSLSASDVWSYGDRTLTSFNYPVTISGNYDKSGYSIIGTKTKLDDLNDINATSIWNVATRSLTIPVTTSGVYDKTGYSLLGSITTLDGLNNLSASQVWSNSVRNLTHAVDVTGIIANRIDVTLSSRQPSGTVTLAPIVHTGATIPTITSLTNGVTLATTEDIYYADIQFTKDGTNSKDEYTVSWFKNGSPVTTGITSPQIQVVKRSDGTDLVAITSLTQIGASAVYKYDETTNRTTNGEAYIVQVTATIDASTRTWRRLVARDST